MALPVYFEFEANQYSNVFALKAALVDSFVTMPQSDDYTFAVYNMTDEVITNITNGAISLRGHRNEMVLMIQRLKAKECLGNQQNSVVELSQGHLFLCKECYVTGERILDTPQWRDYSSEFMWRYRNFKLLDRIHFMQYLPLNQSEEHFSGSSHQKGVFSLDNVIASQGGITPDTDIKDLAINGTNLGFRLAPEY